MPTSFKVGGNPGQNLKYLLITNKRPLSHEATAKIGPPKGMVAKGVAAKVRPGKNRK